MFVAQASMACQSRKSPSGTRTAFTTMRSGNESSEEDTEIPWFDGLLERCEFPGLLFSVLDLSAEGADTEQPHWALR